MAIDMKKHPCFNKEARKEFGRIHLPVAPRCNIQCNFCNRDFDCTNESRPGVTSATLTPRQALAYFREARELDPRLTVVGIAGPGDPFANPTETMETLRLIRAEYPDVILCVATNGLNVAPYAEELAELEVSHVTITINAVDPKIAEKVYAWARDGRKVVRNSDAGEILVERQLAAVKQLSDLGILVKVNSIIIPGVNDDHMEAIAKTTSELGAGILNNMALIPVPGTPFENIEKPSGKMVREVREVSKKYLPLMTHCQRCRADAVGLLGDTMGEKNFEQLRLSAQNIHSVTRCGGGSSCGSDSNSTAIVEETAAKLTISVPEDNGMPRPSAGKPYIAVASWEGVLINQHLGEAHTFHVYRQTENGIELVEERATPEKGGAEDRWAAMARGFSDCFTVVCTGVGNRPQQALGASGIGVTLSEGMIDDVLTKIYAGETPPLPHDMKECGQSCGGPGTGMGCG